MFQFEVDMWQTSRDMINHRAPRSAPSAFVRFYRGSTNFCTRARLTEGEP